MERKWPTLRSHRGGRRAAVPHPRRARCRRSPFPPFVAQITVGAAEDEYASVHDTARRSLLFKRVVPPPGPSCGVRQGTKPREVGELGDAPRLQQPRTPSPKKTFLTGVLMCCLLYQSYGWARNCAWGGGGERVTGHLEMGGGR